MLLMRQINAEIKPEWDKIKSSARKTDLVEDCEPHFLSGWTDKDPSIWDVSSDSTKPTLENILVALCKRIRKPWDKVAYITFTKDAIDCAKLILTQTNGKTGNPRIDTSKIHYEIKDVTAKQICTLIFYITQKGFATGLFKKSEFEKILIDAYDTTQAQEVQKNSTSLSSIKSAIGTSTTKNQELTGSSIADDSSETENKYISNSGTK